MRYRTPPARGPERPRCFRRAGTAALLLCWFVAVVMLVIALLTGTALAQTRARVAVLRFEGAPKLQAAVAETLAKEHHLVPLSEWEATASELSATGFSADQIAIVAM